MDRMEENSNYGKTANLPLVDCLTTHVKFGDERFSIMCCKSKTRIERDSENFAIITLINQEVPYKATILGGYALSEEITGEVNYKKWFHITWEDEDSMPSLVFHQAPSEIKREYEKGQKIELGIEDVRHYHVIYQDEITADFIRKTPGEYDFFFSTGFSGSIRKDTDGTHSIQFKGIPVDPEDDHRSESKFILTRSRYSDNLLLVLQDKATVLIELNILT